jgi:hypothetical protein
MAPEAAVADHVHHHDEAVLANDAAGLEAVAAATMSCCAGETLAAVASGGRTAAVDRDVARALLAPAEATAWLVPITPSVVPLSTAAGPPVHARPLLVLRI